MPSIKEDVAGVVTELRATYATGATRDRAWRMSQLLAFQKMLKECRGSLCEAMATDLHKSTFEGYITEVNVIEHEVQGAIDHLDDWMAPQSVANNLLNLPGKSYVYRDPLGVVLIIGAWNYPVQLSLAPLVGAIAAGCCAVVKLPSDKYSSASSRAIAQCVAGYLDQTAVRVVEGDREATQAVLAQRWDKIFFTGGSYVGKMVAEAAAKHLTPTCLELGGKSPCIVDRSADLDIAAKRICWGAFMNAGQTCVRPDYLLVHADVADAFLAKYKAAITSMYSEEPDKSEWFGRAVNGRACERLAAVIATDKRYIVHGGASDVASCFVAPTVLDFGTDAGAFERSASMESEIFGPISPLLRYTDTSAIIERINAGEKPLGLYVFTTDSAVRDRFLRDTSSGAADVNDVIMHMTNDE
jgi:acyl-CoA reductase-like NAD-dependent aldehyde dehydrogenase